MRITKAAIAGILALFAVATASAQQFPTIQDHSVIGRIGVVGQSGPSQAIPFASLLPLLEGVQPANKVKAGPPSGADAIATYRLLVGADLPNPGASSKGGVQSLTCGANQWLNQISVTGVPVCAPISANTITNAMLAQMAASTTKCNNTTSTGAPVDCTIPQFKALQSINISVTDPAYGAKGDCTTDDTAAFQAAWNAAKDASGFGKIHVPATATCYLVNTLNGTNANNIIIEGDGDQSVIKVNNQDAQGNWWDLSGSNNIQFKNLKLVDNGGPVGIIFLWACTGTSCGTSGVLSGLSFDHVNINAKHRLAGLFAYGFGCAANCASNVSGASLNISNSSFRNTNNGSVLGAETRNASVSLSAYNAGSIRSAYVTLTTSTAIAARTHIYNSDFIDQSTTGSTLSNNAAGVTDGVNQMMVVGGSFQCQCVDDFIGWTSDEGVTFLQTAFQSPVPGSGCVVTHWLLFGGGVNAAVALIDPFFSCPGVGGAVIALDAGTGAAAGGIWFLTVLGNDVGLNTNGVPFIGKTAAGCGSFTATNNWIIGSNINLIAGANNIDSCGGIDNSTILQLPGTITLTGAAVDKSLHVGGTGTAWSTFTPSPACGTATFTVNSAKRKTLWQFQTTFFEFDITFTALGTCTAGTPFTLTLPVTANSSGGGAGRETASNGRTVGCTVISGSASMSCEYADVSAWANGNRITVSGVIENQ
jgi:hypothetical protein